MALKILIADMRDEFLTKAKEYFVEKMYEVETARSGRETQLALYNIQQSRDKTITPYFALIINLGLQNHSGTEVLKFAKNSPSVKRIVAIVESEAWLESKQLNFEKIKRLGAEDVMFADKDLDSLNDLIDKHQSINDRLKTLPQREGTGAEEEVSLGDDEFTAIQIDDFFSMKSVMIDIYIKLTSSKYVKILHSGDTFNRERIEFYKTQKQVKELYFHNRDRLKFMQYYNYLTQSLMKNEKVGGKTKVKLMKSVAEKVIEEALAGGMRPQVVEQGQELIQSTLSFVEDQKDLHILLKEFNDFDPKAMEHSYAVMLFASSIMKLFSWKSKPVMETLSLACLFHDIGKMKLPENLRHKRPEDMTPEELTQYQEHPRLGADMLEHNVLINPSVRQMIAQHHEYSDGTGYPQKLKGGSILILAMVIHAVDDLLHEVAKTGAPPIEVLKRTLVNKELFKKYPSEVLENFIKIFVDPEKLGKKFHMPTNSKVLQKTKVG
jgi:putative nucleotidyltransferase with HDIG domain